jgi:hypothetical protein
MPLNDRNIAESGLRGSALALYILRGDWQAYWELLENPVQYFELIYAKALTC